VYADAMVIRGRTERGWTTAVVGSLAVHILALVALSQLPGTRMRIGPRPLAFSLDLAESTPLEETVLEPVQPVTDASGGPAPQPELFDLSAVGLPELDDNPPPSLPGGGVDPLGGMSEPALDLIQDSRPSIQGPSLGMSDRGIEASGDRQSAQPRPGDILVNANSEPSASFYGDFTPSLSGDKAGARTGAMVIAGDDSGHIAPLPIRGQSRDRLAPVTPLVGGWTQRPGPLTGGSGGGIGGGTGGGVGGGTGNDRAPLRPGGASHGVGSGSGGPGGPSSIPPEDRERRRVRTVEPSVPSWVEEQGIEAYAKVRIQILEDGRIGTVELTVSSGYRELDNLAIGAVKQWLYDPGTTEYRTVRVNFKLR